MDTHEEWREVDFTNNKYSVSSEGRIRNNLTGNILKPSIHKRGYLKINLEVDGKRYSKSMHRLIALTFIPNPENKAEVNHINGIHDDNRVVNLEWVTPEENIRHSVENHLREKGMLRKAITGESWKTTNKSNYLKNSDRITENEYNKLINLADSQGATIYGLFKNLLDENKTLKRQIDNTQQNDFLVRCQKQEIKSLSQKVASLQRELDEKPKLTNIGTDNPEFNIGEKKNFLTIIGYAKDNGGQTRLVCRCDCGNIRLENQYWWRTGKVKSCGCKHDELGKQANPSDPRRQTQIYDVWTRYNRKEFWCEEWRNFDNFYEWSINNGYEKGKKLCRADSYKEFSPENCHWRAKKDYKPKNRRKYYDVFGEKLNVTEMGGKYGILPATIAYRLKQGLTPEQAVTIPMHRTGVESNSLGVYYANNE